MDGIAPYGPIWSAWELKRVLGPDASLLNRLLSAPVAPRIIPVVLIKDLVRILNNPLH